MDHNLKFATEATKQWKGGEDKQGKAMSSPVTSLLFLIQIVTDVKSSLIVSGNCSTRQVGFLDHVGSQLPSALGQC